MIPRRRTRLAPSILSLATAALLLLPPADAHARVEGYPHLDNETLGMFNMLRAGLSGPTDKFDILYWGDLSLEKTFGGMLGFTRYLAAASAHAIAAVAEHTPAYRAPYREAYLGAMARMLHHRSWDDWLKLYGDDPIADDNVMFKGYLFYMMANYQRLFGDRRYELPVTLVSKQGKTFSTDIKALAKLLAQEQAHEKSSQGEHHHNIPCEPGQVFVICNTQHRVGFEVYDRLYGTKHAATARTWLDWTRKRLVDPATGLFYYMYKPLKSADKQLVKTRSGIFNSISIAFLDALDHKWAMGTLYPKFKALHVLQDAASPHGVGTAIAVERPGAQSTDLVTFALNIATTEVAMIMARSQGEKALHAKLLAGLNKLLGQPAWEADGARYGYSFIRAVPLLFQNAPALWARATTAEYNLRKNTLRARPASFFSQPHVAAVGNDKAFVNQAIYDPARRELLVTVNGGRATTGPTTITVTGLESTRSYSVTRDGVAHADFTRQADRLVITTPPLSATEEAYRVAEAPAPASALDEGCAVAPTGPAAPAALALLLIGLRRRCRPRRP